MIFAPLADGRVQAFNAETLESLWVYQDTLKGQSLSPITYSDGYIYTGFWNAETKDANYVCIPVTDEDPTNAQEAKEAHGSTQALAVSTGQVLWYAVTMLYLVRMTAQAVQTEPDMYYL